MGTNLKIVCIGVLLGVIFTAVLGTPVKILEKKESCVYENITYHAGEHFKPDPCTFCHCSKHGGQPLCAIQDCMYEPNCIKHDKKQDECCGTCVEVGCQDIKRNVYKPGQLVIETKCERCYCPDGGGMPECDVLVECPPPNCVDMVYESGDCCPKCPNGPNCYLNGKIISADEIIQRDNCEICMCPEDAAPFWKSKTPVMAVCSIGDCS